MTLTAEQKKIRTGKIPCSLVGAIVGVDKYKSAYQAYLEITCDTPDVVRYDNAYAEWGHRLEPTVAKKFAEKNNVVVTKNTITYVASGNNWLCGTPDYFYAHNSEKRGLEIKTTSAYTASEYGDEHTDEIPAKHYLQCLGYMIITDTDVWDLAVLIGGSIYKEYRVTSTPAQKHALIQKLKTFYDAHIAPRVPPPLTTIDDVNVKYPTAKQHSTKAASQEMLETISRMHTLMSQIKTLEESHKVLDVQLRDMIADTEEITDPQTGEKILTYKHTHPRKTLDIQRLRKDYPRIYDEYTRQKEAENNSGPRILRFVKQ